MQPFPLFSYLPLSFVAFGMLIILMTVRRILRGRQFARHGKRVPGVVSDVRTRFTGRGEHMRASEWPVLTFTTVDGREITTEAATPSGLGVGDETEVLYDSEDPTTAVPAENVGGGYGGIVVGLIAIVVGLVFFAGFRSNVHETGWERTGMPATSSAPPAPGLVS
ncbi:DUF3592 domain-containing protein [Nonomuraea sp. NPDC050691]|uniref:DUF3592 domain-containing protein n=1 Tax=Nonomuraea sp. NPDC050691 TaxID=3155661 RepID=UPI0034094E4B